MCKNQSGNIFSEIYSIVQEFSEGHNFWTSIGKKAKTFLQFRLPIMEKSGGLFGKIGIGHLGNTW